MPVRRIKTLEREINEVIERRAETRLLAMLADLREAARVPWPALATLLAQSGVRRFSGGNALRMAAVRAAQKKST